MANVFSGALMWAFLPQMATNFILARYYDWKYAPNSPSRPRKGTKKYRNDYKKVHILVILAYLIFNFYQSIYQEPRAPTPYEIIGVPKEFTTQQLKSQFRKLSLKYHPDKIAPEKLEEAQETYLLIRDAYEILRDPIRLKAYEKFGPSALQCKHCHIEKDYLYYMIPGYIMHYVVTGFVLLVFFVLFGKGYGRYWRFLIYFGTAAFEANILIADHDPIPYFLPWLLVFEKIKIIRQLNVTFFIALTHIGPDLIPEKKSNVKSMLKELNRLSIGLDKQNTVHFVQGYEPFEGNKDALSHLQRSMGKLAADLRLFDFKEIQSVYENMKKSKGSSASTTSTHPSSFSSTTSHPNASSAHANANTSTTNSSTSSSLHQRGHTAENMKKRK